MTIKKIAITLVCIFLMILIIPFWILAIPYLTVLRVIDVFQQYIENEI